VHSIPNWKSGEEPVSENKQMKDYDDPKNIIARFHDWLIVMDVVSKRKTTSPSLFFSAPGE
jgi:hypothetical protein